MAKAKPKPLYELTHGGLPAVTNPTMYRLQFLADMVPLLGLMEEHWGHRPDVYCTTEPMIYISASFTVKSVYGDTHRERVRHKRTYIRADQPLAGGKHPFAQACALACPYYNGAGYGPPPVLPKPWPAPSGPVVSAAEYADMLKRGLDLLGLPVKAPIRVTDAFNLSVRLPKRPYQKQTHYLRTRVSEDTLPRAKPHLTAKAFAKYLLSNRDNGPDTTHASLWCRHRGDIYSYSYKWQAGEVLKDVDGRLLWVKDAAGAKQLLATLDLPPDPLEKILEPVLSRKLVARLKAEGKPHEWCPGFLEKQEAAKEARAAAQAAAKRQAAIVTTVYGRPSRRIQMD